MADASSPTDPNAAVQSLERAATSLDIVSGKLDSVSAKMAELFGRLGAEGGQQVEKLGEGFKRSTVQVNQMNSAMQATKSNLQGINLGSLTGSFDNLLNAGEAAFMNIARSASTASNSATKDTNKVIEGLSSLAAVGAAGIRIKAHDMPILKQIKEAQEFMMPLQKTALQTGIAFGQSFEAANAHVNAFMSSVQDSINVSQENASVVSGVATSLGEAFGAIGATKEITSLSKAINMAHGSLNLMNVALLTGKAVGVDASNITNILNQAHLELGESVDGAALSLGRIGMVAEKSGLSYKKVADTIISSTATLKMFGGTIGSVAPIFEKFSESLGEGRKGLATDLIQSFTSGLKSMGFETRALLGMQSGMGGRGGAIGAGLEMEAALEGGEGGMQKIMDSLTNTLEKFGGGQIIGRQEAIEDPTLQRNFMIQRQLLQNMMGLDTASANKTLDMLKEVQQTGLKTGQGQEEKLAELIGSGQAVAQETTTDQVKAINNFQSTLIPAVKEISAILKEGAAGTVIAKLMGNFDDAMKQMAKSGKFDITEFSRSMTRGLEGKEAIQMANQSLQPLGGLENIIGVFAEKAKAQLAVMPSPATSRKAEREETRERQAVNDTVRHRRLDVPAETLRPERRAQVLAERNVSQRPAQPEIPRAAVAPRTALAVPAPTSEPTRAISSDGEQIRRMLEAKGVARPPQLSAPVAQPVQQAQPPSQEFQAPTAEVPEAQPLPALRDTTGRDMTADIVNSTLRQAGIQQQGALARNTIDTSARPQAPLGTSPQEAVAIADNRQQRSSLQTNVVTETVTKEKQGAAAATVAANAAATANVAQTQRPPIERDVIITARLENDTIKLGVNHRQMLLESMKAEV